MTARMFWQNTSILFLFIAYVLFIDYTSNNKINLIDNKQKINQCSIEDNDYIFAVNTTLHTLETFSVIDYSSLRDIGIYAYKVSLNMDTMSDDLDELLSKNATISTTLRESVYNYIDIMDDDVIAKYRNLSQISNSSYYEQKSISKTFITATKQFITLINKIDFKGINQMIFAFYDYIDDTYKKIAGIITEFNSISAESVNICILILNAIQQDIDNYNDSIICDNKDIHNVLFISLQSLLSVNRSNDNKRLNNLFKRFKDNLNNIDMISTQLLNIKMNILNKGISVMSPGTFTHFIIADRNIKYKNESDPHCFRKYQIKFGNTLNIMKRNFIDLNRKYK